MSYKDWHWNYSAANQSHPLHFGVSGSGILLPPEALQQIVKHKNCYRIDECKRIRHLALLDDPFCRLRIQAHRLSEINELGTELRAQDEEYLESAQQALDTMLKSFDSSFFNSTANTDNVATSDSFAIPNAPFMSVAEQGLF